SVWLSMCPMCRRPVTLGGGRRMSKTRLFLASSGVGLGTSKRCSLTQYSAQCVSIAPGSYVLGSSCGIGLRGLELGVAQSKRYHRAYVRCGMRNSRRVEGQIGGSDWSVS